MSQSSPGQSGNAPSSLPQREQGQQDRIGVRGEDRSGRKHHGPGQINSRLVASLGVVRDITTLLKKRRGNLWL